MKERDKKDQEPHPLHKFVVFYQKTISTWRDDYTRREKTIMMLDHKPFGEERRQLERQMEDEFIDRHHKHRGNLADITYKITQIRAVPSRKSKPTS